MMKIIASCSPKRKLKLSHTKIYYLINLQWNTGSSK